MAAVTAKDKINTSPLPPPTICQTLQKSFRLPFLNVKPTIAILLQLAIPSTIIFFISDSVLKPITLHLTLKFLQMSSVKPGSPEYDRLLGSLSKDLAILWGDKALFFLASTIVTLVTGFATIYATHAAYTSGEKISIKSVAARVAKGWKQPLITFLYIQLFSLGFVLLLSVLVGLAVILYKISFVLVAIFVLLIFLCAVFYLYLTAVWTLAIIVAAVEEGCYGLAAIVRAGLLIKGRKMQGLAIAFYFMLATAIISFAAAIPMGNSKTSETVTLVLGCVMVNLAYIISFFRWVVLTVFYFGCKMNHGEEVNGRDFFGYSLVSSGAHIDAAVP